MKGYKEPGFQDRAAASARAKDDALERLKAAPKRGKAEQLAGKARQQEREAKDDAKRKAAREAKKEAERLDTEKKAAAAMEKAKTEAPVPTEAELKAARDERYAARKRRKG
jgi:hypothetical protein